MHATPAPFVIFIITKLELGGAQKVCLSLFQHFSQNGNALLFAGAGGILDAEWQADPQVKLFNDLHNDFTLRGLWQDAKAFWQLYQNIKQQLQLQPNLVVHTHSTKAGLLGRWAAWLAGVDKIVHTVHGFGFNLQQRFLKYAFLWLLEKFCSLITWKYVFVSVADLQYAQQKMQVKTGDLQLIRASAMHLPPPAKNIVIAASKAVMKIKPVIIGTVSCFKPQKNLMALLETFRRLVLLCHFQPLKLIIVGDGMQRPQILAWIEKHQLQQQIQLCGWQSDLTSFYQSIDVFALSSLWEGLPCAVIESLLFQKPVVAFDVGGLNEVVQNGKNGFLVAAGDIFALTQRLKILITQPAIRQQMLTQKLALEDFALPCALQLHQKMYQQGR